MSNPQPARVAGIDLSLTSTGLAVVGLDGVGEAGAVLVDVCLVRAPEALRGLQRMRHIVGQLRTAAADCDLVVVEGPTYNNTAGQRGHHERAGLWWMVYDQLDAARVPIAIAPPQAIKTYATGRGNASKELVQLAVADRFPAVPRELLAKNDVSDAIVLAALGADHLGTPLTVMPKAHRKALETVAWPSGEAAT